MVAPKASPGILGSQQRASTTSEDALGGGEPLTRPLAMAMAGRRGASGLVAQEAPLFTMRPTAWPREAIRADGTRPRHLPSSSLGPQTVVGGQFRKRPRSVRALRARNGTRGHRAWEGPERCGTNNTPENRCCRFGCQWCCGCGPHSAPRPDRCSRTRRAPHGVRTKRPHRPEGRRSNSMPLARRGLAGAAASRKDAKNS